MAVSIQAGLVTGAPGDGVVPASDRTTTVVYARVARTRRRAVVVRRGPRRWVRLLLWDLETDTLQGGQWFKGKLGNTELNSDGTLLLYYAATYKPPFYTWTAISRPPYFTALALWSTTTIDGGGMFAGDNLLKLNHARRLDGSMPLAPGFQVPPDLEVVSLHGENSLDRKQRMEDWTIATVDSLRHREEVIAAINQVESRRELGQMGWVGADHNGDVLFSAGGCLYRIRAGDMMTGDAILVADLNGMVFEPMKAPDWALR